MADQKPIRPVEVPWNQADRDEVAGELCRAAEAVVKRSGRQRRDMARACLALYEGNPDPDMPWQLSRHAQDNNVIRSVVDTRASHVFRNKVRPFFLTDKGNYDQKKKAQGMQRAVEGTFQKGGVYGRLGQHFCWDGEIFEGGFIKVVPDYENVDVSYERTFSHELHTDERDALRGYPVQLYHVRAVARVKLLAMNRSKPKLVKQILEAPEANEDDWDLRAREQGILTSDRVMVVEGWSLPSYRVDRTNKSAWEVGKTHDGRHTLAILDAESDMPLIDEAWVFPRFPFMRYLPFQRREGFWSQPTPQRLYGTQLTLTRMSQRVDAIMKLHAIPRVYVNRQARIDLSTINNAIDGIITGNLPAGAAIQFMTSQSVPGEYLARIERLRRDAYESEGLSELSATSRKPAGLESGRAMQTILDSESMRHTNVFRSYEDAHVEGAWLTVDAIRLLAEHNKGYKVLWGDNKDLKQIDWKSVDLEDQEFILGVTPQALLPQLPEAKLDYVEKLLGMGLPREAAMELLGDFPDIRGALGDFGAPARNIERMLHELVEGKDLVVPHAYLPLELALTLSLNEYNRLEADGWANEHQKQRVRDFIDATKAMIQKGQAPPPAPAPEAGAPPMPAGPPMNGATPPMLPPPPAGPPPPLQ